ncbi:MAG TPA: hypothetical protein PLU25_04405, partial [Acidobacteriota bacterium]|nr:hypothetical protein [Acidobacteriota bacterium]
MSTIVLEVAKFTKKGTYGQLANLRNVRIGYGSGGGRRRSALGGDFAPGGMHLAQQPLGRSVQRSLDLPNRHPELCGYFFCAEVLVML